MFFHLNLWIGILWGIPKEEKGIEPLQWWFQFAFAFLLIEWFKTSRNKLSSFVAKNPWSGNITQKIRKIPNRVLSSFYSCQKQNPSAPSTHSLQSQVLTTHPPPSRPASKRWIRRSATNHRAAEPAGAAPRDVGEVAARPLGKHQRRKGREKTGWNRRSRSIFKDAWPSGEWRYRGSMREP